MVCVHVHVVCHVLANCKGLCIENKLSSPFFTKGLVCLISPDDLFYGLVAYLARFSVLLLA